MQNATEKQPRDMRHHTETSKSALFVSSSRHYSFGSATFKCSFCRGKGHNDERGWDRDPSFKPYHLQSKGKESSKTLLEAAPSRSGIIILR